MSSLVPRSHLFIVLQFTVSIIHGKGQNGEGLGILTVNDFLWIWGGRREVGGKGQCPTTNTYTINLGASFFCFVFFLPYVHFMSTWHLSHDNCSQFFPIFATLPLFNWTECKPRSKKKKQKKKTGGLGMRLRCITVCYTLHGCIEHSLGWDCSILLIIIYSSTTDCMTILFLYFCRQCCSSYFWLWHKCCCGHCCSHYWHHCTYCWIPGWNSGVLLHKQLPITERQTWLILPTPATDNTIFQSTAANRSRVCRGAC